MFSRLTRLQWDKSDASLQNIGRGARPKTDLFLRISQYQASCRKVQDTDDAFNVRNRWAYEIPKQKRGTMPDKAQVGMWPVQMIFIGVSGAEVSGDWALPSRCPISCSFWQKATHNCFKVYISNIRVQEPRVNLPHFGVQAFLNRILGPGWIKKTSGSMFLCLFRHTAFLVKIHQYLTRCHEPFVNEILQGILKGEET